MSKSSGDMGLYLFHQGTNYTAYDYLGAHLHDGGAIFRTWAPTAAKVSVVGDFNGWDADAAPMTRLSDEGVWEAFCPDAKQYDVYQFAVTSADGTVTRKNDPYGVHSVTRPGVGSKLFDVDRSYEWGDAVWLKTRADRADDLYEQPLNIYEVHAGSWKRYPDGNFYSYEKLADELIPYVKHMGYTHLELMPLSEYPLDASWGYQSIGYFAPTSRYGTPDGLRQFVDRCHRAGIGVIMDWVCAHFPKDECGLYRFDGDWCYEYADDKKRESPDWGTCYFDYGRNEVASFLISNADYWISKYHFDGLRVDAVSSMLYLDYGRNEGQWTPNRFGGKENLEALALLRRLNAHVLGKFPGVMMIAEESTSWGKMTHPIAEGGLGFTYKWDMGWMNDTLAYMQTDPFFRKGSHGKLTFSMMYAFSEHYILPISHDEVVHGKKSLLDKMPGDYWQKFANTRVFMAYMAAHPGKKLLFMGCEYGPFREWDFDAGLEWFMLDFEAHRQLHDYTAALNDLYLRAPELWSDDRGWDGFCWLEPDDADRNVIAFTRTAASGEQLVAVFNFSPVVREGYTLGMPEAGSYAEVFNSDDATFGGSGVTNPPLKTCKQPAHGQQQSVSLTLPPLGAVFLRHCSKRAHTAKKVTGGQQG